jgi:hypothetical protein
VVDVSESERKDQVCAVTNMGKNRVHRVIFGNMQTRSHGELVSGVRAVNVKCLLILLLRSSQGYRSD